MLIECSSTALRIDKLRFLKNFSKPPWRTGLKCACLSRGEHLAEDIENVSELIAATAERNHRYMAKVPRLDCVSSDEDASEIRSDGKDKHRRLANMPNGKDEYIYQLRVERADRNRRIYTDAKFKDVSTQTWADLKARALTYEIWNDDEDWEIRMQAFRGKSEAHTILFSNLEGSNEFTEQFKQEEKMKPIGTSVSANLPIKRS